MVLSTRGTTDHAGDEEFRGRRSSYLEQSTWHPANCNSLPLDVCWTSEGSPVWFTEGARLRTIYDALYKSTHHHHHHQLCCFDCIRIVYSSTIFVWWIKILICRSVLTTTAGSAADCGINPGLVYRSINFSCRQLRHLSTWGSVTDRSNDIVINILWGLVIKADGVDDTLVFHRTSPPHMPAGADIIYAGALLRDGFGWTPVLSTS